MALSKQIVQPPHAYPVDPYWLARGLKFVNLPTCGFMNLGAPSATIQSSTDYPANISQEGVAFTGNARAEIGINLDTSRGMTLISVWHCRDASNYTNADSDRTLLSNRTAGNAGWSWGRSGAVGGGAGGNVTRQGLTFQGVAAYAESNYSIESLVDTPVACRYDPVAARISWFRFGLASSGDTIAGTPSAGGNIVFGAQGDYASNGQPWIDKAVATLAFEGALTDSEIALLTSSVISLWQVFQRPRQIILAPSVSNVSGNFASTLAGSAMAASGLVDNRGSFTSTLAGATMAASGSVGSAPSGSFASTLAGCTMSATGLVEDRGSFASTLAGCTMAASGVVAPNITGTFASTLAGAAMSSSGYVGTPPVSMGTVSRRRLRPRVVPPGA